MALAYSASVLVIVPIDNIMTAVFDAPVPAVTQAAPNDLEAQTLKRDVYAKRIEEASALMAQGIFRAAMIDARVKLGEEPVTLSLV